MGERLVISSPSSILEREDREKATKIHSDIFVQDILLPGVRSGEISKDDYVYNVLENYRRGTNTTISIGHVFRSSFKRMELAIKRCQSGRVPLDFFETDSAFTLVVRAVLENDRLLQEPECKESRSSKSVPRVLREVARKIDEEIGLKKREIGSQSQ